MNAIHEILFLCLDSVLLLQLTDSVNSPTSRKEAKYFIMKDWSIFSKLDHTGGYLPKFPVDSPISHDIGLGLISQVGNLVESSFQHQRHICSTGSGAVHETFNCFNKFAGAFYFWFSRASNPKLFQRLSAAAGSSSRACRSHIKQVTSCLQHLPGLQFGSQSREEHAVQMLLAKLASATFGPLWTEVEERHACNVLMLAAATVIPPFENMYDFITVFSELTELFSFFAFCFGLVNVYFIHE